MKSSARLVPAWLALLAGCASLQPRSSSAELPQMVRIEPGRFVAGSDKAETDAAHYPARDVAREQPRRVVTISRPFAIAATEVTRGQFARFAATTGWRPDGPCSVLADGRWVASSDHDWMRPGFAQIDDHPVVCVNLADAEAYTRWLSVRTGRRFRLPSGIEWEYAARAGTVTARWWGDGSPGAACAYANLSDISRAKAHNGGIADPAAFFPCNDGFASTAPVGSFKPNPWGLYDMLGNVWEWTVDCLKAMPLDEGGNCSSRIDRGASWGNSPKYVRAATQHPDLVEARTAVLGFRIVEDIAN